ncbi:response regulator [Trichothermofontia sp.]
MLTLPTASINILIVDDTPDNLRLLAKMLEAQGYVVRKSLNGRMALQSAHRDPPDLILLDINMPDMNGYEVCQQLKASAITQKIPIIFISALDQINSKLQAFESGGQDYITKPFQELEVLARVRSQLLIQEQQRQLRQQNQQLEQAIQVREKAEAEIRHLNADLERRVKARTLEIQQALAFEATLKRISDQVRDCLNSQEILQRAVEELMLALALDCCNAVFYDSDFSKNRIYFQAISPDIAAQSTNAFDVGDVPEVYEQLHHQKVCFAFCQLPSLSQQHEASILVCPIFDDQVDQLGILGELWLFKRNYSSFGEMEINLAQQVANQCAIALRQAKLYEAAQAQVTELQRLHQLKDDFLSTISHELRSPIASMKMVIQLLSNLTQQEQGLLEQIAASAAQRDKVEQYLKILREECDRELLLIEDLLSLKYIEAGTFAEQPTQVNCQALLTHLVSTFQPRAHRQGQQLQAQIADDLPIVNCDLIVLNRILTELLTNACKYTPRGETITVTTQRVPFDPLVATSTSSLQIAITNTGVEIPAAELGHIFDKFYRIPSQDPWKQGGTGLGLTLVKKMVEQIGGTIQATSADNQTCFMIGLTV